MKEDYRESNENCEEDNSQKVISIEEAIRRKERLKRERIERKIIEYAESLDW